jgi:hypothetical protein
MIASFQILSSLSALLPIGVIQSVPGGKVNIPGGHSIGYSKQEVYMCMCPIPDGFRDTAISLYSSLDLAPKIVLPSCM